MGANEYLERLEGKIRKCLFFYIRIFLNNSVTTLKAHSMMLPLQKLDHPLRKQHNDYNW